MEQSSKTIGRVRLPGHPPSSGPVQSLGRHFGAAESSTLAVRVQQGGSGHLACWGLILRGIGSNRFTGPQSHTDKTTSCSALQFVTSKMFSGRALIE